MSDNFDKYLEIANHDIQRAKDYGQLKSYVASILYDHDKKAELLQQKENKEKEIREYIMTNLITEWDIENDGYVSGSDLPADAITPILEILDKENK